MFRFRNKKKGKYLLQQNYRSNNYICSILIIHRFIEGITETEWKIKRITLTELHLHKIGHAMNIQRF